MKHPRKKHRSKRHVVEPRAQSETVIADPLLVADERPSPLITVDLILTLSQRLRRLPECSESDLKDLYKQSKLLLNYLARKINEEGLTVSLGAIVESIFLDVNFQQEPSINLLLNTADDLIEAAGNCEFFLSCDRFPHLARSQNHLTELENALKDQQRSRWFSGAKQIVDVVNPSDASNTLKEALKWFLNFFGPINPLEYPVLREFLDEAIDGKEPNIPGGIVALFRERYLPTFKTWKELKRHEDRVCA
jgi:hypothetical protein